MDEYTNILLILIFKFMEFFLYSWLLDSSELPSALQLSIVGFCKIVIALFVLRATNWNKFVILVLFIEGVLVYLTLMKQYPLLNDQYSLQIVLSSGFLLTSFPLWQKAPKILKPMNVNLFGGRKKSESQEEETEFPNVPDSFKNYSDTQKDNLKQTLVDWRSKHNYSKDYPFILNQTIFNTNTTEKADYSEISLDYNPDETTEAVSADKHNLLVNIYCWMLCQPNEVSIKMGTVDQKSNQSLVAKDQKGLIDKVWKYVSARDLIGLTVFSTDELISNNALLLKVLECCLDEWPQERNERHVADELKRYYIIKAIEVCPDLQQKMFFEKAMTFKKLVCMKDVIRQVKRLLEQQPDKHRPADLLLMLKQKQISPQLCLDFSRFIALRDESVTLDTVSHLSESFTTLYPYASPGEMKTTIEVLEKFIRNEDVLKVEDVTSFKDALFHDWSFYKSAKDAKCNLEPQIINKDEETPKARELKKKHNRRLRKKQNPLYDAYPQDQVAMDMYTDCQNTISIEMISNADFIPFVAYLAHFFQKEINNWNPAQFIDKPKDFEDASFKSAGKGFAKDLKKADMLDLLNGFGTAPKTFVELTKKDDIKLSSGVLSVIIQTNPSCEFCITLNDKALCGAWTGGSCWVFANQNFDINTNFTDIQSGWMYTMA